MVYAQEVCRRFGHRLASICTFNEPWVISILGYEQGFCSWYQGSIGGDAGRAQYPRGAQSRYKVIANSAQTYLRASC